VLIDGAVEVRDGSLTWTSDGGTLTVSGVADDVPHGTLPARARLSVRRSRAGTPPPPTRASPLLAAAWRQIGGDPGAAIGVPAPAATADDSLIRRHEVLAEVQEHYYIAPPRIERGWREYLIDVDGRVYLDMVNNVASVGHAHPHVVEAGARQMHLLNTNSRFHYRAITDFADRIAATLPDGLDSVFLVNSGSEATDLAIRLAMAATGRPDIVAMREAYHGWTYASDAVSTSIADNPFALETRPSWVHTVDAANSYRGVHRGPDAQKYAPEAVAVIDELAASGRPPAGLITETFFGNAGGVALPEGYLTAVYAAIRRHGGLAIADEVQVGYGRLGEWFWGFQQQQAEPDIVAVAKSIGGGHPLGAVITRREIADRYRTQGYFFSSTGGSPVSSAIGLAVLDVIEQEGLQENARIVGAHLKSRLEALARRHDLIGAVHGSGLYLGVEFVRDRSTLEPATAETAAICDRLLELGVIMQPTGDFQNVLKIKPPLVVTRASVDVFVDALDRVLTTGW
jgi:4-aminobutyrate aminotransferase-like enzyme